MVMPLPARPSKPPGFIELTMGSAGELALRYFVLAGIAWMLGYVIFKRRWFHRKIIQSFPQSPEVRREMAWSALSIVIFAAVGAATIYAVRAGWTRMYGKLGSHSTAWFWSSIVCAIFLHDTWFYWTHRLMHHPRLFRVFHRVHHLSRNPTPWAAYAFSPLEAVMQAAIFPLIAFLIPIHHYAFGIFMLWQIAYNIAGHTGYEYHPRWLMRSRLRYLLNTPTNHIQHHETLRGNYGLYFNFWDQLMGTNHADYESRYTEVITRPKQAADANNVQESA